MNIVYYAFKLSHKYIKIRLIKIEEIRNRSAEGSVQFKYLSKNILTSQ